jgi:CTP:molybdopterin cytidylyltransferase MocA
MAITIDAVLPAAGRIRGAFAAKAGVEVKALVSVGGRTVLSRTLSALRATGRVGRIVIVGPHEVAAHPDARGASAVLPETEDSGPANILRGLEWLDKAGAAARVLVITTDLPFLTPAALVSFLDSAPADQDICLPVVRRQECEARFPRLRMKYVHLRDGDWTIGCAFLVNPRAIRENRDLIERTFAARKSRLAMARLLGVPFLLRFLLRRLTVADIEQRARELLACPASAVMGCPAELAFDIDGPRDYGYAVRAFAARGEEAQ